MRQVGVVDLSADDFQTLPSNAVASAPRWSPDGGQLAVPVLGEEDRVEIAVHAVPEQGAATPPKILEHQQPRNILPRWSANSRALAYQATSAHGEDSQIMVYDVERGEEEIWADGKTGLMKPVWLPSLDLMLLLDPNQELSIPGVDADQFVEEATEYGAIICIGLVEANEALSTEIFVITKTQALMVLPIVQRESLRYVEWQVESGRQGRFIAFESNDGGDREIYVLGRRGILNVSNHRAADWNPVWAPHRDLLLFESFRDERRGIYQVHPETAHVQPVAALPDAHCWAPAWSPEGNWVAYISDTNGAPELYVTDLDDTTPWQIESAPSPAYAPQWRPKRTGE